MKRLGWAGVALAGLVLWTAPLSAGTPLTAAEATAGSRGPDAERGPLTKLGRGVTNVVFSFIECGTNIQESVDEKGLPAFFEGAFKGLFYTAGRILSGAYDAVTFLIPIPESYGPVMKPEYVFESSSRL